jgi:hypothetical protein
LGEVHDPKEESIKAFKEIEAELKKKLIHERHEQSSTPPHLICHLRLDLGRACISD